MMNKHASRRVDLGAAMRAPLAAMQWRLLLLWVLLLLLPTAVVSLPLWRTLSGLLDHSVHAQAWATKFSPLMFGDTMSAMSDSADWLHGAAMLGLLLTLLLSPFLNGMGIGSGRAGRAGPALPHVAELVAGELLYFPAASPALESAPSGGG